MVSKVIICLVFLGGLVGKLWGETGVTCKGDFLDLQCDGNDVILIRSAIYGRTDETTCADESDPSLQENTDCTVDVVDIVREKCDRANSCNFRVNSQIFPKPCSGTSLYVTYQYECKPPYPVIHILSLEGHYRYSWGEAKGVCASHGMTIARRELVQQAFEQGMDVCACGWFADGTAGYPIVTPREGCGSGSPPGIRDCATDVDRDVYCNAQDEVPVYLIRSPEGVYRYTFEEAKAACEANGDSLATRAQLDEAWNAGFDSCACGWLADGTAVYPTTFSREGCGSAAVNVCDWSDHWDGYCA